MKKIIFFCFVLSSIVSFSQDSNFWDNVRFGGTFGLSFGSNSTTIAVSPSAVYDFNEEFSIGASIGYLYNKSKSYSANIYSASIITLYRPIRTIEFSGELIQSYVNKTIGAIKDNYSYPSLNLGAAYVTGKISFGVQYDVLHKENKSIYSNPLSPFVRVFF
jgi:long-subunit fatty acid transport protein